MAVKPFPKKLDEDHFIEQGAPVLNDRKKEKRVIITVGLPQEFLKLINAKLIKHIGLSRNAFILQAIQRELEKD